MDRDIGEGTVNNQLFTVTEAKERKGRKTPEQIAADIEKYGYTPLSWLEKDIISAEIQKLMREDPEMDQKKAVAMGIDKARKLMNPSRYLPNLAFPKG